MSPSAPKDLKKANNVARVAYYWMGPSGLPQGFRVSPEGIDFTERIFNRTVVERSPEPNNYRSTDQTAICLLEVVFELVRIEEFPTLPCRFRSIFLWDNLDWALAYQSGTPATSIYKVRLSEFKRCHLGDYSLITNFDLPDTVAKMRDRARRYWSGQILGKYELEVEGSAVVEQSISPTR